MKKLFLGLAFVGLLLFAFPTVAKAEVPPPSPCYTYTMTCGDGTAYYVICCSEADKKFFAAYYC